MSCGRIKGRKPKSAVNRISDDGQQSKLSIQKHDVEESSVDDFDISASDKRGKQNLSSTVQNVVTSQSRGRKLQQKRQRTVEVGVNKNAGDPNDLLDLVDSKRRGSMDTGWNESKLTDVDLVDSADRNISFDHSDFLVHETDFLKTSTPCSRKSQRTKRATKWTDDFVLENAVGTKFKRPRLSASVKMLDSSHETSNLHADDSVVSIPLVKRTRSIRSKKFSMSFDHEDLEQEIPSSVDISGNRSTQFEEKECVEVIRPKIRRRSRQTSNSEQLLTLEKSNLSDTSEENRKKFSCFHCGEVKKTASALRIHMAAKHHRIWTSASPEGRLDEYACWKLMKSIKCLKCDKLCHTFALYRSHIQFCGREEERVDCDVCGKNIRVMSYDAHVRYMHKRKVEAENLKVKETADETHAEISSNSGRLLRRAAVKARNKLLELSTDLVQTNNSPFYSKPQYMCPDATFPADFMKKLHDKRKKLHRLTCCYQDCSFEHSEVSEVVAHLLMCSHKPNFVCNPEEFTCLACGDSFQSKSEVVHHISQHDWTTTQDPSSSDSGTSAFSSTDESSSSNNDDDDDDDSASAGSDLSEETEGTSHSKKKRMGLLPMTSFLQQHCLSNLFPNWEAKRCLYEVLSASEESHYLPQNPGLAFKIQTSETEFSPTVKLDLFETYLYNDSCNINVGGPIWALAWSPMPSGDHSHQYLAVYAHRTPDETHPVNECSSETALIQLWRFQLHDTKGCPSEKPEMIGGLLLNCGPIWEMKWCPTGSWNEGSARISQDLSRIGLLAVASHSGDVHILSVPQCFPLSSEEHQGKLYRVTPVATLRRRGTDGLFPCLCLDWHWKEECGMLMAGFADGTTSLWDLHITSSLLRLKAEDGRDLLFPFQSIRSHVWPVKGVAFCQSQLNLLVTCSADRMVKLWDLTEPESPLATYHSTFNTGVVWPVNCTSSFACSGDDCYLCEKNGTILCSYVINRLVTRPLTVHNAAVWGMSYNCWSQCLVSCDSVGVVIRVPWISPNHKSISNSRQVLFVVEMSDSSAEVTNCQLPTSIDVRTEATENDFGTTNGNSCHQASKTAIRKGNDVCECKCHSNETAKSCDNSKSHLVTDCKHCHLQHGLLFKDFSTEWQFSKTPILFAKQLPTDNIHNSLPCSLNRVAWNTNYGFHEWLAAGGQAGILRIKLIAEIKQSHIKTKRKIHKKH